MKDMVNRVADVTLVFWIIKIMSTTVGETGADFLAFNMRLGMPLVTTVMLIIMGIILFLQFTRFKKYVPMNYWSLVVLMSITGTLITDMLVDIVGVSLVTLSIVFTIAMLAGFWFWYQSEKTLSIHSIDTTKREVYYWIIILLAFALGTGVGDLISEGFSFGYFRTLIGFGLLIGAVALAHYKFGLSSITAFWIAFIMTRPLGASLGDLLTQAPKYGGLGINMMLINAVFLITIILLVGSIVMQRKKIS